MKKHFLFLSITLIFVLAITSCNTTNLSENQQGLSNKIELVKKDYDIVGFVNIRTTETITINFFGLIKNVQGSKPTYSALRIKAIQLGADDVIDVKIDKQITKKEVYPFGGNYTYTYYASALAIKYKDIKQVEN